MKKIFAWIVLIIISVGICSSFGYVVYREGWAAILFLGLIIAISLSIALLLTWAICEIEKKI